MSGYYGTDQQKSLQQWTFENRHWIADTPGLYNAGRFVGTDDPDRAGWDVLDGMLKRNGILGLRLITPEQGQSVYPRLTAQGYRIDHWDVFVGEAQKVRPIVDAIARTGLPNGLMLAGPLSAPEGPDTVRVQTFLAENGMAPFPGSMLVAGPGRATVVVADQDGAPVAVAHTYFPHNGHSPHHRSAWVGLVAVAPAMRGTGLGRTVNALAIRRAVEELGAERVYELVSPTNEPSRRMVKACGLSVEPGLLCGVAVPADASRFTR